MHLVELSSLILRQLGSRNWWALVPTDLEQIATALLGSLPGGWVRQGDNYIRIRNEYGASARHLTAEFSSLAATAAQLRDIGGPVAGLRAAAFYHLRFAKIHPLVEGNGRTGRMILAMQLHTVCGLAPEEALGVLQDWAADYEGLFATERSTMMFELLLELLGRMTGIVLPAEAMQLPTSLEPLHPQKSIPKTAPRLHPEAYRKNPALLQKAQPTQRGQPFFRKFR